MTGSPHFGDNLAKACAEKQSAVCVGLDPRWQNLPDSIKSGIDTRDTQAVAGAIQCYCQEVVDAVASSAPVVKPQAAFFEQLGPAGAQALSGVIQHARKRGLLVLLDGKRGDIGSTAEGYASAYLGEHSAWGCDALTVNPYLGKDTLEPFARAASDHGAGIFVLVKTSNPGSGFVQDLNCDGKTVFERVAEHVQQLAQESLGNSGFGNVGAVVGATYPEQLQTMRATLHNAWILIPGYGAQGGTAQDVQPGFRIEGDVRTGAIVNSSRGIIFAYQQAQYSGLAWQEAVAQAAADMRDELRG